MDNSNFFTVCNVAYLSKAILLARSLHQFQNASLNIVLFDSKRDLFNIPGHVNIFWINDFNIPGLAHLAFKYDITEFSTSLKPWLAMYFLENSENVIFLDPDTYLYSSLSPVFDELLDDCVLLTPHYIVPKKVSVDDSNLALMKFGSFNLGFFAISRGVSSLAFLQWWSDQCMELCFFEPAFGMSTDQKWVSIAPCFFPCIKISYNKGLNVAMWNLHERRIGLDAANSFIVNDQYPLIFMHFSSFDAANPSRISRRSFYAADNMTTQLLALSNEYAFALQSLPKMANDLTYGFDYMNNGYYISPILRRAYSCVFSEFIIPHDPFDIDGPVGQFARKNFLISKAAKPYSPLGYSDMSKYSYEFTLINGLLKIIIRLLGPNSAFNLSRLLVYLSSYRQNRGLWKL